jgi:hypothetical protein
MESEAGINQQQKKKGIAYSIRNTSRKIIRCLHSTSASQPIFKPLKDQEHTVAVTVSVSVILKFCVSVSVTTKVVEDHWVMVSSTVNG